MLDCWSVVESKLYCPLVNSPLNFLYLIHACIMYVQTTTTDAMCTVHTLVILASSAWVINALATRLVTPREGDQLHPCPVSRACRGTKAERDGMHGAQLPSASACMSRRGQNNPGRRRSNFVIS